MAVRNQGDTVWVTKALGQWVAAYRFVRRDGAPVLAEVRVFPREREDDIGDAAAEGHWSGRVDVVPPGGMAARLLRELKPGEAAREARGPSGMVFAIDAKIAPSDSTRAGATPPLTIEQRLARVAVHYVLAVRAGSRHPNQDVALKLGVSDKKVTEDLRVARRKGILAKTLPGQTGGDMTEAGDRALVDMLNDRSMAMGPLPDDLHADLGALREASQPEDAEAIAHLREEALGRFRRLLEEQLLDWMTLRWVEGDDGMWGIVATWES